MGFSFCECVSVKLPVVLAPMGGAVGAKLAAAVSNAGGLGILPLWRGEVETLRKIVRQTKSLTSKPFAVNLNLDFPQEEHLDACLEEGVPIISFFWGDPSPLVRRAKDAGAIVLHSVGNAEDARKAVDSGVDVIVAQGWEAGGHVFGNVATLPLIPAVVDAVGDIPVVAAGGIADGRGLAAVLALGASAAWVGTRFLASEEAQIHPDYQQRVLAANENDTSHHIDLFNVGWPNAPHRVLRNSTVDLWEAKGRPPSGDRPSEGEVIAKSPSHGDIVRYQSYTPGADAEGDIEALSMWAGQGLSLVRKRQPAAEIVEEIVNDARATLKRVTV
jgi:NAD(P)H-dependent flavin oxidoreductase YrpB (nitropropane dioxygenase family)